jgi:hypothetical protein
MTIFTTNERLRIAPDGAVAVLYVAVLFVYEGLVWIQALLIVKKMPILPPALVSLTLGRLSGLRPSGWRGAFSAEGVQKQHLTTAKRCSSGTSRPVFIDNRPLPAFRKSVPKGSRAFPSY